MRHRYLKKPLFALLVPSFVSLVSVSTALAEVAAPQWTVSSVSQPTLFAAGGEGAFVVLVTDTGGGAAGCTAALQEAEVHSKSLEEVVCPFGSPARNPITITEELPEGLAPVPGVTAKDELAGELNLPGHDFAGSCRVDGEAQKVSCTYEGVVQTADTLVLRFPVRVAGGPADSCAADVVVPVSALACVTNVVRVSGGGASTASRLTPTFVYGSEAEANRETPFGVSPGGASTALSSVQAGAHPDITTSIAFNTIATSSDGVGVPAENFKDTIDDLPAGFAGDLVDTPACPAASFLQWECPTGTQIGVITIIKKGGTAGPPEPLLEPVFNLSPEPGEVAKIGFSVGEELHYEGDISLRAPGEGGEPYGLRATFFNATANVVAEIDNVSLTVWGVPASPKHNALRTHPLEPGSHTGSVFTFGTSSNVAPAPYFTNPTACGVEPLQAQFTVTSWQHPSLSESPPSTPMPVGPIVGCDRLSMEPSLSAEATSDSPSSATGLDLATRIPQTYDNPSGLATSTLKREVVILPEGMTVNPSAGAGLAACSQAQYAEEGTRELTAGEKSEGHGCPNASKLATVRIKTPSIEEEVTGSVFLATPYENPFSEPEHPGGTLLALYLIARAGNRGVLVKAPGIVQPNLETGRLITTFDELPPLPFSLATFSFNQGANAPLVTPSACGDYEVNVELTPWANPEGSPLTPELPPLPITTNCPPGGAPPFNPGVTAYPIHANAGAYSPLYLKITRQDDEQEITGFSTQLPAGLTGNLSGVAECSEADVEAARHVSGVEEEQHPSCPASSEVGYSISEAGVGNTLAQAPGKIYSGAPYEGAPFSIVSVTAAKVGPFDLGTVVVHLPLFLNPETAQVTVGSGTSNQIPHIIKGIVIHVRNIRVYVDRQNFILNPTSCAPMSFAATVIGGGADPTNPADNDPVTVNDPYQAADCANLAFKPKFSASTESKDSFNNQGASLKVNLAAKQGPNPATGQGVESNIAKVKVELPISLPSRLTTLQKACLAKVFEANPANCPPDSFIGHAVVHTPILPVPLEGPAIFVSHGGEAFPSLILVLQGYGVKINLVGQTFISKAGITSSTFKAVPDQPFNTFELTLPTGKFSALAAITNVCKPTKTETVKKKVSVKRHGKTVKVAKKVSETVAAPLLMPTEMVAQNGAVLKQSTKISVTGCKAAKAAKKKKAKKGKKGGKGKKK